MDLKSEDELINILNSLRLTRKYNADIDMTISPFTKTELNKQQKLIKKIDSTIERYEEELEQIKRLKMTDKEYRQYRIIRKAASNTKK